MLITVGYALSAHMNVARGAVDARVVVRRDDPGHRGDRRAGAGDGDVDPGGAARSCGTSSWHLLHLYAYVGVGLSIPHEIWTGQDFTTSGAGQRAYWMATYAVAAGAVVVFRIGLPVVRTLRHGIRVTPCIGRATTS